MFSERNPKNNVSRYVVLRKKAGHQTMMHEEGTGGGDTNASPCGLQSWCAGDLSTIDVGHELNLNLRKLLDRYASWAAKSAEIPEIRLRSLCDPSSRNIPSAPPVQILGSVTCLSLSFFPNVFRGAFSKNALTQRTHHFLL